MMAPSPKPGTGLTRPAQRLLMVLGGLALSACTSWMGPVWSPEVPPAPPPGTTTGAPRPTTSASIVPVSVFRQLDHESVKLAGESPAPAPAQAIPPRTPVAPVVPREPTAWVYASDASQQYMATNGMDPSTSTRLWETFLRKYDFPYLRISTLEELERVPPSGVLVLPSVAVMSESEKQVILKYMDRGGSVLSTWLTGVRDPAGRWSGFDFMAQAFDVRVAGTTENDKDDNFLFLHGNSPISHNTPAGLRVWLERIPNNAPLRLASRYEAGQIMDWARDFSLAKRSGAISFNERKLSSGGSTRSVTLGIPERVFLSMDARVFEGMAYDIFAWLFHQPAAYVSDWPYPYKSAAIMAVEAVEDITQDDLGFAQGVESVGGRATFYLQSSNIKASARQAQRLQERGHELGYFADRTEGFRGQSPGEQSGRIDAMIKAIDDAGVKPGPHPSFAAPLDSFDDNTRQILARQHFGSMVVTLENTEARLPFFDPAARNTDEPMVFLPRTQRGPEEYMTPSNSHDDAMITYLRELDLASQMGGLSVIRIGVRNHLTEEQRQVLFDYLNVHRQQIWIPTASQAAQWWRDRSTLSTQLEQTPQGLLLHVTVGKEGIAESAAVWVDLPQPGARLTLRSLDPASAVPPVGRLDPWRSAIILQQLPAGEYRWLLSFDPSPNRP